MLLAVIGAWLMWRVGTMLWPVVGEILSRAFEAVDNVVPRKPYQG